MQDNSAYYAFVMWRCSEVVTTRLTRNQLYRKVPWVRIPPSPPKRLFPLAERLVGFLFSVKMKICLRFLTKTLWRIKM